MSPNCMYVEVITKYLFQIEKQQKFYDLCKKDNDLSAQPEFQVSILLVFKVKNI